jgi:hypothetical protein
MILGVKNALPYKIVKADDSEFLEALKISTKGFTNVTPIQMLLIIAMQLEYMDVTELMEVEELTKPWEGMENPVTKFVLNDKIEYQLIKTGLTTQAQLQFFLAMSAFKTTG